MSKRGDTPNEKIAEALVKAEGHKGNACKMLGISYTTLMNWRKEDPELNEMVEDLTISLIEDKLHDIMNGRAEANTTSAVIFYLKCKGKKKGWTEKADYLDRQQQTAKSKTTRDVRLTGMDKPTANRIAKSKRQIIKMLKEQNLYTPERAMQVDVVAVLFERVRLLKQEIFGADYQAVVTEISREGNRRAETAKQEDLLLRYTERLQSALRALGMNADSKESRNMENSDAYDTWIQSMQDDGDDTEDQGAVVKRVEQ